MPYNDTAVYTQITTTSNILFTDFVARDAVLNTKITTTSNILFTDFVARDAVLNTKITTTSNILFTDFVARDVVLNTSIETNKYTDAKVLTYLQNINTKSFGGWVGIGTTDPQSLLEINGSFATLRIVDNGVQNPRFDLIRGTGAFGNDAFADWRIENIYGDLRILRGVSSSFTYPFTIVQSGRIGIYNDAPIAPLTIGNSAVVGSDGYLVLAKCTAVGTSRHFRLGLNTDYDFTIGDFGNNNTAGSWIEAVKISNLAGPNSLNIRQGGVGIGHTNPTSKFMVGSAGGGLTIATTTTGFSQIGTRESDADGPNTRIILSAVSRTGPIGDIQYLTTGTTGQGATQGRHQFYCMTTANLRLQITDLGVRFATNMWHGDLDARNRFRFNGLNDGITYMAGGLSGGLNARTIEWIRLYDSATLGYIENTGLLRTWGYSSLSDERIKKDIEDIQDDEALIKILALKPKKYNYIEKEKECKNKVLGFIAQEVAEIIPEAIAKTKGIIPNIYKFCDVVDKRKVFFSIPQDLAIDTEVSITKDELGEGKNYKIKEIYNDYFVIDEDIEYSPAFVKGYEVNDLHNIKKDMIFSLNVSATQELHKIIMEQKEEITALKERLARLEAYMLGNI